MLIECENCNKKFDLDENLIPEKGRLLQCGSCGHKWFFKKQSTEIEKKLITKETLINKEKKSIKKELPVEKNNPLIDSEVIDKINTKKNERKINKNKFNYFKIFLVVLISLISIIVLLDTFKKPISLIYPNIDLFLDSLYQSLLDIYLFLKDLIK
tara:strand:+ start:126 stop:590 length:465 start_codon:yes stop_codon:yes gene_type:complete